MTVSPTGLLRATGLSAAASGVLFALMQFIHPLETVPNVQTAAWANVHYIGITMCVLGMIGVLGIYVRQIREAGVLGLVGCLMLCSFYMITAGYQFIEAFALPEMADDAPALVTYFLGIATGKDTGDLGAVTLVWPITGALYVLGGLVFSTALYRAKVLARWACVTLAAGTLITLTIPAVPHSIARTFAFPVALAMVGLGLSLWRSLRPAAAPAASLSLAV